MIKKYWKLALVGLNVGGLLAFIGYQVSLRSEVLGYAWSNTNKVEWLMAADQKAQADSQLKVKEALARLFIEQ